MGDTIPTVVTPAPAESQKSAFHRFSDWVRGWVEPLKPFKEAIGFIGSACVAVSASVAWGVSYLATQTDITNLECRFFEHVEDTVGSVQPGMTPAKWRRLQAGLLLQQDFKYGVLAQQLIQEAETDDKERQKLDSEAKKKFKEAMAKCQPYLSKPRDAKP